MMDRDQIRFNVLRNALYHSARFRSLERINRFLNFVVLILGASAMATVVGELGVTPVIIGAAVAFVGALQLVFDFGRAARDHQVLQKDYYNLLADIEAELDPDEQQLARYYSRMIRASADEAPMLRVIDAKAYNDAIDSLGVHEPDQRLYIPWWHRLVGWLVPFDGHNYPKFAELKNARKVAHSATP